MTRCHISGVGLCGPGLEDWAQAKPVLTRAQPYEYQPTVLPASDLLPPNERRRAAPTVRLALAIAEAALRDAGLNPAATASVFASSGGDGETVDAILQTLAGEAREVSPTRFHNSVHNAPSGYWSIATGCTSATTSLCAFDGSFAAGLLDAVALVRDLGEPVLLVAYDTPYPAPLSAVRDMMQAFGVALVLSPEGGGPLLHFSLMGEVDRRSRADEGLRSFRSAGAPCRSTADPHPVLLPSGRRDAVLEAMELHNPAARSLPLLELLATGANGSVMLGYLPGCDLTISVTHA